jgi:hypothetical protein
MVRVETDMSAQMGHVRFSPDSGNITDIAALRICVESRCDAVALGSSISVAAPFVRRCLTGSTMAPFSHLCVSKTSHGDFRVKGAKNH